MRLIVDMIEYCTEHMPKWNTISISGYHIREAGSTAAQELAFTLRDGIEYVQWCVDAGMDVDDFAPRLSFFFNSHTDFFEEIAKFRAARRIWARTMKERFGAKNPRSWMLPVPHPDRGREPHRAAALQQRGAHGPAGPGRGAGGHAVAAHELAGRDAGPAHGRGGDDRAAHAAGHRPRDAGSRTRSDPLGGSYFVEKLTNDIESGGPATTSGRSTPWAGWCPAIERGFPQREIQEAAFQFQKAVERKEKIIVGVNEYVMDEKPHAHPLHRRVGGRGADGERHSPARRPATRPGSCARSRA